MVRMVEMLNLLRPKGVFYVCFFCQMFFLEDVDLGVDIVFCCFAIICLAIWRCLVA